jgi:hypothetical protein
MKERVKMRQGNKKSKLKNEKKVKVCIFTFVLLSVLLWPYGESFAGARFYHGKKQTSKVSRWHTRNTEHFSVMYQDKYIDPEKVLLELCEEFNIQPRIAGRKIKVFIQEGHAHMKPGKKEIHVWDYTDLRHELTHVLFYQINRNVPFSIREGIATYAQYLGSEKVTAIDIDGLVSLEKQFVKVPSGKTYNRAYAQSSKKTIESKLYNQGYHFVAYYIQEKGIEEFKDFYKKCSNLSNLRSAWQ